MPSTGKECPSCLGVKRPVLSVRLRCLAVATVLIAGLAASSPAADSSLPMMTAPGGEQENMDGPLLRSDKNRIALGVAGMGVIGVTAWGVVQWDYFSRSPHAQSEGWFGKGTDDGGMDKLGHMYTSYILSHGISCLYEYWDFEREDAALYGSLTSFAIMGYMEFGDSFSDYGFSGEDMIFNALGSLMAYLVYVHPELASKVDFRWQLGLHPSKSDFVTDYENSKFLLALKLNGFESMQESWLRNVELHVGYFAEGFEGGSGPKYRHPYVGVGFNLTDLFRRHGCPKTATVFNYVQLPYTSFNHDFDL